MRGDPLAIFAAASAALMVATVAMVLPPPASPVASPAPKLERRSLPKKAEWNLQVASWYGRPYHGRPTASGEIFDRNALTYASRTDRFGRLLHVEVAGHSVVVRCNDRGPLVSGRDIDLSEAAAERLGMLKAGVAIVSVREVHP